MKKFIQLLLKKRFKILKSKRGFSLLEVLIAVAIIGIISAIAVPQFAEQRKNAAQVASDTSASNVIKAFQNCVALKPFNSCKTLEDIKVNCPAGTTCASGGTGGQFCAHLKRGTAGQDDFNICVSVNSSSGSTARTYGGALLTSGNVQYCKFTLEDKTGQTCTANPLERTATPLKLCTAIGDCTGSSGSNPDQAKCQIKSGGHVCATVTTVGNCDTGTGICT